MFYFGLIVGIVVGTVFHAVFAKWGKKAKDAGQELVSDVKNEINKTKS